jgi:hypothetical protein
VDDPRNIVGWIGYTLRMDATRSASVDRASPEETAERAARIAAMLDRWNAEDVSKEPDWSIADLQPITLRHSTEDEKPTP